MTIKTSREALEEMCERQPDHPVKYGLGKLAAGLGLGGLGGGMGYCTYGIVTEEIPKDYPIDMKVLGGILAGFAGLISVASSGAGLYFLADGATSLAKPFGLGFKDGSVYYRNGGFINNLSLSDKRFGKKVSPIEEVSCLDDPSFLEGYVFANGILVKDSSLTEEENVRMKTISMGKSTITIPETYTEYTAVLSGELNGEPLKVYAVTESSGFAYELAGKKGESIYVLGNLDEDQDIDVEEFGDAMGDAD